MFDIIHLTDLYRPHNDLDDHYDIALSFALSKLSYFNLKYIIIDENNGVNWQPDFDGANEVNELTGGNTIIIQNHNKFMDIFCKTLMNCKNKVIIHVCGSCRTVIDLYNQNAGLFKSKVEALYLNAGSALNTKELEYNVTLDKNSYSKIFQLPCKIYWLPCFENVSRLFTKGKNGSFYHFKQELVLSNISKQLLNYFLDASMDIPIKNIKESLNKEIDPKLFQQCSSEYRNMYCTAGFLHCAGISFTDNSTSKEVCSFKPIIISSNKEGRINWKFTKSKSNIYILNINNLNKYEKMMTNYLVDFLSKL